MYVLRLAFEEIMDEPLIAIYLRVTLFYSSLIYKIHLITSLFLSFLFKKSLEQFPLSKHNSFCYQGWIQDFLEGALTPKGGIPSYYSANFPQKLHENKVIWAEEAGSVQNFTT